MTTQLAPGPFYRRKLPHIQLPEATLFVTFRLADSLPRKVLEELHAESQRIQTEIACETDTTVQAARIYQEHKRFFGKWDQALDKGFGPHWL